MSDAPHIAANIERFMGFADQYDRYRPSVPPIIIDILTQLARIERPQCVVDLGCGTGLSTRMWVNRADEVVGIEPSDDMRRQAETRSAGLPDIRFQKGLSIATGLPDACADIVTASQALHWMEPVGTFAEVARILRPGGVFAAIDNDWPPTFDWEAEKTYRAFLTHAESLASAGNYERDVRKWNKREHLQRMQESEHFRYTKEIAVHNVEVGSAERMVGLVLSQGVTQTLLKNGVTIDELGIPAFRADLEYMLGSRDVPWYFTYRVRIGIR